jgi:transforming growth factor-beta-induced protein
MARLLRFAIFAVLAVFAACSESLVDPTAADSDPPLSDVVATQEHPTIAEIVTDFATADEGAEFTILLAALQATGLDKVAAGTDPITVFAPTDAAFARLLEANGAAPEDLLGNKEILTQVLLYHVLPGAVFSGDVLASDELVTAQGGKLFPEQRSDTEIFIVDQSPQTEDAQLILDLIDVKASNGVIHVIDEVLFYLDLGDEEEEHPTIAEIVTDFATADEGAEFTILLAALQATGLDKVAAGTDPITVFAPTDAAFARLLEANGAAPEDLLGNKEILTQVLLYHVLPGAVFSGDVLASDELVTAQGGKLFPEQRSDTEIFIVDQSPQTEDAQLILDLIDVKASNGVIHVIDEVLFYLDLGDEEEEHPTIAEIVTDFATADEGAEFTILLAALQATGLDKVAAGTDPITVFAPTDAAFARLLEANGAAPEDLLGNKEILTQVLLYHVLPGAVFSGDVLASDELVTAQGGKLFPEQRSDTEIFIVDQSPQTEDAQLILDLIDVKASNGVIHVIDEVLFYLDLGDEEEEHPTIAEIVTDFATADEGAEFTILLAALQATGLDKVAAGTDPITVFAPTDAAFARLLEANGAAPEDLLGNKEILTQVLLYHVLPGAVFSGDVLASDELVTAQGGKLFPEQRSDTEIFIVDQSPQTEDAQLILDLIDVKASNGVIHVIDEVLFYLDLGDEEEEHPTIAEIVTDFATADEGAEFTILLAALQATGLDKVAAGTDPITVFAPTDAAFARLLEANGAAPEDLLGNKEILTQVLLYHVLPGAVFSGDVLASDELVTAQGGKLFPEQRSDTEIFIVDQSPQTEDAQLILDLIDVKASNGVIHVIDEVLFYLDLGSH